MTRKIWLSSILTVLIIYLAAGHGIAGDMETIYIADGGYYTAGPFATWSNGDLWANMTVIGNGSVDVYIMTTTQYHNSYSPYSDNASAPLAVSFQNSSVENISSASIHIQWNYSYDSVSYEAYTEIYVVIDNRDCILTADDASPSGPATVRLDIDVSTDNYDYGLEWLGLGLVLVAAIPIILVIIIVVVIVLVTRKSNSNQIQPPPYYYPVMPPQPPQPPPTGK